MTGRHMTTGFRRREASDESRLLELRLGLAAWLGGLGLEPHQADDVMLATCEAMTNAFEHAYRGGPGEIDVHADLSDGRLTVTVTDWGIWKPEDADDPTRGRGLILVRGLTDSSDVERRGDGTTVRMTWVVAP